MTEHTAPLPPSAGDGRHYVGMTVAGLAPTEHQLQRARREAWIGITVLAVPLVLLLAAMYARFHTFVGRIEELTGFFAYIFPAVIIAFIAALTWVAVTRAARGNALGDQLGDAAAADAETSETDAALHHEAEDLCATRDRHLEAARAHMIDADTKVEATLLSIDTGRKIAAHILEVAQLPAVNLANLTVPTWKQRNRIAADIDAEQERGADLDPRAKTSRLPAVQDHHTPWDALRVPPSTAPDLEAIGPHTSPVPSATASAEAGRRRGAWVRPLVIVLAVLAAVGIATVFWLLAGSSSAAADSTAPQTTSVTASTPASTPTGLVPAHPPTPTDLLKGRDYSFLSAGNDGPLVRWSCDRPIPVELAGAAPTGADQALAVAVRQVADASGLPLTLAPPVSSSVTDPDQATAGGISVSYLDDEQITAAHLDLVGDTLGRGGPRFAPSGSIPSGWVALRADQFSEPTSKIAETVLMHELAHAVGLGHSSPEAPTSEIMAPTVAPATDASWGTGDRYALAAVGCTRA